MSEGLHFPTSALIEKHLLAVFSNRVPIAWILACDFAPVLGPVSNKKSWVVWFAYRILLWKCSVLNHFWSPASRESIGEYLSKTFLSVFLFFLFSLPGVRHPGEPAGWKPGGGLHYIWEQVRQLPQVHGVQRPGLSELQAAEAGGLGSTWRPHRPLPTAPWSVIACTSHTCHGQ